MAMAMMKDNQLRGAGGNDSGDRDRMGRLVLARMKTLEESFADVIKEMRDLKKSSTVPTTRRNSSGDEGTATQLIEVAGRDRLRKYTVENNQRKVASKRPVSRRSFKEAKPDWDTKGKGKEVAYESDDEAETDDSLFQRGGSL
jgi:hypothetical protein